MDGTTLLEIMTCSCRERYGIDGKHRIDLDIRHSSSREESLNHEFGVYDYSYVHLDYIFQR